MLFFKGKTLTLRARKNLLQEKRIWHVLGQAPIEGRLRENDGSYVTTEVEQEGENQRLRSPVASPNAGEFPYLRWLDYEAISRLLGRFEQWQVDASILRRMKTAEQKLQGVWKITAGDADVPPNPVDRHVMIVGDQIYIPSAIRGQPTRWNPQRFLCDPVAKPHAIMDRYKDGIFHTCIYELRGNVLRIEFEFLARTP